ncbi:hypothetical protein UFOVP435_7 [uncultured Caudovirales phage]|uniref:HNH nuclease n=1 Tax=uncultured Caudovirales phage TaxID=2100421 RepID=A0A6J5MFY0_9CAUD|nr:hypothetical protein UFOVP435_7 [uncultured Caudovirales phage]
MSAGQLGAEKGELIFNWLRDCFKDPVKKERLTVRLARLVDPQPDGCILWKGALNNKGYGKINVQLSRGQPHQLYVHHLFFVLGHARPITKGMTIDHTCRRRCCVNPAHHEEVTVAVNNKRKWEAYYGS